MHKLQTKKQTSRINTTWRERAFAFGGIAVATATSGIGAPVGAGTEILAPVWLAALAWTILATIAHAFWRGFRLGDWSAFQEEYEPPHHRDNLDLGTGTGVGAYRRIAEQNEQLMRSSPS